MLKLQNNVYYCNNISKYLSYCRKQENIKNQEDNRDYLENLSRQY